MVEGSFSFMNLYIVYPFFVIMVCATFFVETKKIPKYTSELL